MVSNQRYNSLIQFYAHKESLPWRRVWEQIRVESAFDPSAESNAGAVGLMQFVPDAWADWGQSAQRTNPEASIQAGCRYMSNLYSHFEEIPGDEDRYRFALASYNAGRGSINQCLVEARTSALAPAAYKDWIRAGKPPGVWQTWSYTSTHLYRITGEYAQQTLRYVEKILPYPSSGGTNR